MCQNPACGIKGATTAYSLISAAAAVVPRLAKQKVSCTEAAGVFLVWFNINTGDIFCTSRVICAKLSNL